MPRSYQPELMIVTSRPLVRSTIGPQAAVDTIARSSSSRTDARMRAILEHPHLNALQRLVARDAAGQKLSQIRSPHANDARARAAVGRRQPRPIVVALGRDGQPFVRPNAERAAVREHRIL